jgi:hypothetical protein
MSAAGSVRGDYITFSATVSEDLTEFQPKLTFGVMDDKKVVHEVAFYADRVFGNKEDCREFMDLIGQIMAASDHFSRENIESFVRAPGKADLQ